MKELNSKETELVCGGFLFSWANEALTNLKTLVNSIVSNIFGSFPKFNL